MNENQQPIRNNKILFGQKLSDEQHKDMIKDAFFKTNKQTGSSNNLARQFYYSTIIEDKFKKHLIDQQDFI